MRVAVGLAALALAACTDTRGAGAAGAAVVEAVVEDLGLKHSVFRELERRAKPNAILATNTSSLLVGQLQEGLAHPERVADPVLGNAAGAKVFESLVKRAGLPLGGAR